MCKSASGSRTVRAKFRFAILQFKDFQVTLKIKMPHTVYEATLRLTSHEAQSSIAHAAHIPHNCGSIMLPLLPPFPN